MKIYIAARAKYRAKDVARIQRALAAMGHEVAYDWPANNSAVKKPYRTTENRQYNLGAQVKMLKSAAEADAFILLDDPGLRGAYVELGAFLLRCAEEPERKRVAYIVGPDSHERQHIFESPEYVKLVDFIDDAYKDLSA